MIGRWRLRVLATFVLALTLAACGMPPTPSPPLPSPPPTRLPPTPSSIPIAAPQPPPSPPVTPTPITAPTPTPFPLPVRSATTCGGIEIRDGAFVDPVTTADAEECFWRAYQVCDVSQPLGVVRTSVKYPSYSAFEYRLVNTGGKCTIEINGSAVPVIVDSQGTRTVGGAPINDRCTGMARDTLDDLLFAGCRLERMWNLPAA